MKFTAVFIFMVFAFSNACESLPEAESSVCRSVVSSLRYPDRSRLRDLIDSDDKTAKRLYDMIVWYSGQGRERDYVEMAMAARMRTFFPTESDHREVSEPTLGFAGDPEAPISIVSYITSTCPLCKSSGIPIYESVVSGDLKGMAKFAIVPIHPRVGDIALLAASDQGKMWDLFRAFGDVRGRLDEAAVFKASEEAGLDVGRLMNDMEKNRKEYAIQIADNHAESVRNDVEFTPTIYINGVRYRSNRDIKWIHDYIEYLLQE